MSLADEYVPKRITKNIDKTTSLMMENGLDQFYTSFSAFLLKLRENYIFGQENQHSHSLSIQQMKMLLIICVTLLIIATVTLVIEITVYNFKRWIKKISNYFRFT